MSDYIKLLKCCLRQCDEMLAAHIADPIGRQMIEDHAKTLRADIARLKEFAKFTTAKT